MFCYNKLLISVTVISLEKSSSVSFLIYTFTIFFIICLLLTISYFITFFGFKRTGEKLSPYECGFVPFEDTRNILCIYFYPIALFFLLFDLEILFIFPIISSFYFFDFFHFYILLDFIIELIIAYILLFYQNAIYYIK